MKKGGLKVKTNSKDVFTLQTMGEYIKWLVENNITHEGILLELIPLDECVECVKQLNCDEPSFASLPKVLLKVEKRINRLKQLLESKASKLILEHEVKRLHVALKHLDLFFRGTWPVTAE